MKFKEGDIIKHTSFSRLIKTIIEIKNNRYYCKENYYTNLHNDTYPQLYIDNNYIKVGKDNKYKKENYIRRL